MDLRQYFGHIKVNFPIVLRSLFEYICEGLTWSLCGRGDLRNSKGLVKHISPSESLPRPPLQVKPCSNVKRCNYTAGLSAKSSISCGVR